MALDQGQVAATATGGANVRVTGRRVVATLVDGLVLSVVGALVVQVFGNSERVSGYRLVRLSPGGSLLLLALTLLYFVLMEATLGRTLGKMATGIRIVDEATGSRPSWGQAIIRTLLRVVDGLFAYLVGFIIVLSSDRRRRLGDIAAKTAVVRN